MKGITIFPIERKRKSSILTRFFGHHRRISAVKRVEFVSDRVSYIVLSGRWCSIIVLNVHKPYEEKRPDSKDSFHEELEEDFKIILSTIWKVF